jgi:hypothetical protein
MKFWPQSNICTLKLAQNWSKKGKMEITQNIDRDEDGNLKVSFEFEGYALELEDSFLRQQVMITVPTRTKFTVTVNGQEYVPRTRYGH